jgi:hypothetical protein
MKQTRLLNRWRHESQSWKVAWYLVNRVLPFANLSGDPQHEYFSGGIAAQFIDSLSRLPGLFVIARNSSFAWRGKEVKEHEIGAELGVKYVLEGSVQRAAVYNGAGRLVARHRFKSAADGWGTGARTSPPPVGAGFDGRTARTGGVYEEVAQWI